MVCIGPEPNKYVDDGVRAVSNETVWRIRRETYRFKPARRMLLAFGLLLPETSTEPSEHSE